MAFGAVLFAVVVHFAFRALCIAAAGADEQALLVCHESALCRSGVLGAVLFALGGLAAAAHQTLVSAFDDHAHRVLRFCPLDQRNGLFPRVNFEAAMHKRPTSSPYVPTKTTKKVHRVPGIALMAITSQTR